MKKLMLLATFVISFALFAFAADATNVKMINDGEVWQAQSAVNIDGSIYLAPNELAELLGLSRDDVFVSDNKITIEYENQIIEMTVGDKTGKVNGTFWVFYSAPVYYRDSVLIPLRFTAEQFGKMIMWDNADKCVYIREAEEYGDVLQVMRELEYPLVDGVVDFTKSLSELCRTVKRNVPLVSYSSVGDYHIDLSDSVLKLDAEIKETYNRREWTSSYKSDGNFILYSDSNGQKYYLEGEEESAFLSDLLNDVGLEYAGNGSEKEETVKIQGNNGALSSTQKIAMYAKITGDGKTSKLVIPYHKTERIQNCNFYNRTIEFDADSKSIKSEKYEAQMTDTIEGAPVLKEQTIFVEFK